MTFYFDNNCLFCTGIIGTISLIIFKCLFNFWKSKKRFLVLKNKNIIITGGSSGIGLSLAKLAYSYGANVTIIARNIDNLKKAIIEISNQDCVCEGKVDYLSLDLTMNYDSLQNKLIKFIGNTDMLINCAGGAISRTFCEMKSEDIEGQIRLNYLGAAHMTRVLLPSMLASKTKAYIVFVSSMGGQIGIYGLAAYSASKFALRGLAECLQMEVVNKRVSITLAFPPDTQTPGFDIEQIGKPEITKKLSSAGGLIDADVVANSIMTSTIREQFFSSIGFDGWLLTQLTQGMCLPQSFCDLISLLFLGPLMRLISIGYMMWMRFVIYTNCQ